MIQKELLGLYYKLKGQLSLTLASRLRSKHACLICQTITTQRICSHCQTQFLAKPKYQCTCCGIPMNHSALFCGECLRNTPLFDRTFSPYLYQAPISDLIIRFKQKSDFFAGKALSELFCQQVKKYYVQQHLPLPDFITPVPQHWKRQWQRGFNPTVFFTNDLSHHLSIPIFTDIKREKHLSDQKSLNREERMMNLTDSFLISSNLEGKSIAIVDDVMTTGATANTLAKALKEAGAGQVTVWALTRTPKT